ncbi:MAG: polyphosphate:AMP phosphotransferase [Myxococcales bacterium]|nr:polyphosphate:AMP phosphotransferase [Myxococcales bacterium]
MFEDAELGHTLSKEAFDRELPALREKLLEAQAALLESKRFPVLLLINGVDGAGKGETVNALHEWLDPRHVQSVAFGAPSDEERERPPMWRFWRALPPKGKLGIFFGNWYTDPIVRRVHGESRKVELEQSISTIEHFERMLTDEGVLLLKFWFHLSKKGQKKKLEELSRNKRTRWRVTPRDWENASHYDAFRAVCERVLRETSTGNAPWIVVDGSDSRYRAMAVGRTLLGALERRLAASPGSHERSVANPAPVSVRDEQGTNVLRALDMTKSLRKKDYSDKLEKLQGRLNQLSRDPRFSSRSLVCVFEGPDAGGKGGAIRRVTSSLDARQYRVVPVAAPTEEERAQPYLWRFWRHIPRNGHAAIFDRSWYGRVLVERVESFCREDDWRRAYAEINDFEEQLARSGAVLCKFWLQVSEDEQLRRFEERKNTGFKHYKITDEDWRNREKWTAYEQATCEMIDQCSTEIAPWTLVPANDKYFARIAVLETICARLEAAFADE